MSTAGLITFYCSDYKKKLPKKEPATPADEGYKAPAIEFPRSALSSHVKSSLKTQMASSLVTGKKDERRIFYQIDNTLPSQVAVVSLGSEEEANKAVYDKREVVRRAAATGLRGLHSQGVRQFVVDPVHDPQAVAEGIVLASYSYMQFEERRKTLQFTLLPPHHDAKLMAAFRSGLVLGSAQNLVRYLADSPANKCTPSAFVRCIETFADSVVRPALQGTEASLVIEGKDASWARQEGMNSFLSVAQGSEEPCRFLLMEYKGPAAQGRPIGLVGKGVTFDSGGISIKPATDMALMKGDMGGAGVMAAAFLTAAYAKLPLHLVCAIPLTENLPSGRATKPGDVFTASNGMTIEVDNTDAEGRLILADALVYVTRKHAPRILVDAATLTGAIDIALGFPTAAAFTSSDTLFAALEAAGQSSGDRLWRMPLWEDYRPMMDSNVADLRNASGSRSGGSCTAAAFLRDFVDESVSEWAHLDIAGTMDSKSEQGALGKGMTGRPVRTLIYWLLKEAYGERTVDTAPAAPYEWACGMSESSLEAFIRFKVPF